MKKTPYILNSNFNSMTVNTISATTIVTTMVAMIFGAFIPNTAHAKLAKCTKLEDQAYYIFVPETDVPKYTAFGHKCESAFSDSAVLMEPIAPLHVLPVLSKPPAKQPVQPTQPTQPKQGVSTQKTQTQQVTPKNITDSESPDLLTEFTDFLGLHSFSDDECLKRIKENHGIATNKTRSCYNIFRYIKALAAAQNKVTNKKKPVVTDIFGPLASEEIKEIPSCSYLKDLNFAILASSSKITFEQLHTIRQQYTKKLYHSDYVEKRRLNEELAEHVEASFPLRGKAICYLGYVKTLGQKHNSEIPTVSELNIKETGIYYFSEDIFRQIDAISTARDIANGRSIDRSPRGYPAD